MFKRARLVYRTRILYIGAFVGLLLCGLVALLLGSSHAPARHLDITVQDDAVVLHGSDASVRRAVNQIASLGATHLRLTASWSALSPHPNSSRVPPAPFDPANASTFTSGALHDLDRAVHDARAAGLAVMIDIAFWAPRWAVPHASPDGNNRYRPNPRLFGAFAHAIAQRYSGHTRDPFDHRATLPVVSLYTVWNEPNHAQFLEPQWRRLGGRWIAESPHIYRAMYLAAQSGIRAVAPGAQILIGATAPDGSATPGHGDVAPLDFLRGLACVDGRMHRLRVPECQTFQPLQADGYAHHPYSLGHPPAIGQAQPDDVTLADAERLESVLAELHQAGRITSDLPLYETEYGYETDPPDPFQPFTLLDQARFIGWSTYLAWRDPNTRMFAQFLLRDSEPDPGRPGSRAYWRSYQTGLYFHDGRPKPAVEAFRLPFWVQRVGAAGSTPLVLLFGQTRAARGGRQLVQVEALSNDGTRWMAVHTFGPNCNSQQQFFTDREGYFRTTAPYSGAQEYRLAWRRADGVWEYGVPISPTDSQPLPAGAAPARAR